MDPGVALMVGLRGGPRIVVPRVGRRVGPRFGPRVGPGVGPGATLGPTIGSTLGPNQSPTLHPTWVGDGGREAGRLSEGGRSTEKTLLCGVFLKMVLTKCRKGRTRDLETLILKRDFEGETHQVP